MKCEELRDHFDLYAIGLAEEPEGSEIRQHLARGCSTCTAEAKRARELSALVAATAEPAEPSPKLRRRILASVGGGQRAFGWAPYWAAAAALSLFAAVYFSGRERGISAELARLQAQMRSQNIELTRLNEALALLSAPETTMASFGEKQPQPPKGKVFVNPSRGVLLLASNLAPAPAGKTYEMWVIPKSGKPVPAGLFQSETDGAAMHFRRGALDVAATGAVAVTVENAGGAEQPTSQPFIVVALP